MPVRRHFFSWDSPLLPQAAAFLADGWTGAGPLDLSRLLVVVPTRQSGRRLREAIAGFAAARGQAAFPPRVLPPEALVSPGPSPETASVLETQLAWLEIFRGLDLERFRRVFPVDPPERSFSWALRLAREFSRLQSSLAEGGLRLADVAAKAGQDFSEGDRWRQLMELEQLYDARLANMGRRDLQAVKIAGVTTPSLPEGVDRIVVLGTPDPLPLALRALTIHAETVPVEVVIFAPISEDAAFDEWGRPLAGAWAKRALELVDFEARVHLCADPGAQAAGMVAAAARYRGSEGIFAVGVADSEMLPMLESNLRRAGLAGYNPEGRSRHGDGLFQLLAALAELACGQGFATVAALARCPDFHEFLHARHGPDYPVAQSLVALDLLHSQHLPPDLVEARRHDPKNLTLAAVAELRSLLTSGTFWDSAAATLEHLFSGRRLELARASDALTASAAEAWTQIVREVRAAGEMFGAVTTEEWWEIALRLYSETVFADEKPAQAVELQGWLELLWEDAAHLMVAGVNDGLVPDAVVGDPFLPESLRGRLGLKTNEARFARDAYLLQAMAACRASGGQLDILLGKTSTNGDPLRPSRLLLRCADADLPQRIAFLFGPLEAARTTVPWRRTWQLHPRRIAAPSRVAVTALRDWLACPFRFYLSSVLRMAAVDPVKNELDALDFGTLCHSALEAMGREPALRDCTDPNVIRDFLLSTLAAVAADRFGSALTLPLIVQLESARQRLARAALVQAQIRADGWVIDCVERNFTLEIEGLTIRGKIDRIDRHERSGAIRVLDYKTSDKPAKPRDSHLRRIGREEVLPTFACVTFEGRNLVWRDLQLPLYLRAVAEDFPGELGCGYFNLPKASAETGIALWDGFTGELAAAAWRCSCGVAVSLREGAFWPPSEDVRADTDEFAALFHHGAAASVAWPEEER